MMTQSTDEFVQTDDIKTKYWLEGYYDKIIRDGETIQVCSGEWRPEPAIYNVYRFWKDPDFEE